MFRLYLFGVLLLIPSIFGGFPIERRASNYVIERDPSLNYRLPSNLKPLHYELTLEPLFENDFIFEGHVIITVQVVEETSEVVFHGKDLIFNQNNVQIKEENAINPVSIKTFNRDDTTMMYHIELEQSLKALANATIEIDYTGTLHEDNDGFYRGKYEENGETKWFAMTQFEANSARRAFPCFDEPALKATFTIHLIRTENYNSISNMGLDSTTRIGTTNRYQDTFKKSVLMSTYLVAFIVSEMTAESLNTHAVYAPKYLIDDKRGVFAVQASIDILTALEQYTQVDYVLDKMYQVAIPDAYFSAGAMENWGLVTYRETRLMYKDGLTTSAEKQSILSIIAHEYAHQWFGNLVSPYWWSYLWLNEGFATYFGAYAVDLVDPSIRMMDQYIVNTVQYAFQSDALESTRAMTVDVQSTPEVERLFDRVAYDKSGSVIRMMEHFVTTPVYKQGLTNYLVDMQFDSAQSFDLWRNLQRALDASPSSNFLQGQTISEIMENWSTQAGFPVVTLMRDYAGSIYLTQDRFLLNKATHDYDNLWIIPINYATKSNLNFETTTPTYWLKNKIENTGIKVDIKDWIILNKQETGYYRVNYDTDNWNLIIDYLNSEDFDKIHVSNRAQLIDDSFNLARSGRLSYEIPFKLSLYLSRETDYVPIYSFITIVSYLNNHISASEEVYPLFKTYVKTALKGAFEYIENKVISEDLTHLEIRNRLNLINWLCKFQDETCLEKMHEKYIEYESVEPDLQSAVYCSGLRLNKDFDKKWDYAYEKYHAAQESLEKSRWLTALGCPLDTKYLERLLYMALGYTADYQLRSGDVMSAFSAVYQSSDVGLDYTFEFIMLDFVLIRQKLTISQINSLFNGIASRISSRTKLEKLRSFVQSQKQDIQDTYLGTFTRTINTIESNIEFYERHIETIGDFLIENFVEPEIPTEEPCPVCPEVCPETCPECQECPEEVTCPACPDKECPEDDGGAANYIALSLPLFFGLIILSFIV